LAHHGQCALGYFLLHLRICMSAEVINDYCNSQSICSHGAGRRVRRALVDGKGNVFGFGDATVVGFLPARLSEFRSELTDRPAALWRVRQAFLAARFLFYVRGTNSHVFAAENLTGSP